MEPISPTGYAHLAALENILRMLTKVCAPLGRIAPAAITSLRTAQAALTVCAAVVWLENIPPPPTLSLAPRGPIA